MTSALGWGFSLYRKVALGRVTALVMDLPHTDGGGSTGWALQGSVPTQCVRKTETASRYSLSYRFP